MVANFLLLISGEALLFPIASIFMEELSSGFYRIKLLIGKESLMDSTGKTTEKH